MKKLVTSIGGLALVAVATLAAGPATASSHLDQPAVSEAHDSATLKKIVEGEELSPEEILPDATQDPAEIDKIAGSEAAAELVVDFKTGEVLAAEATPEVTQPFKITPTSPGCDGKGKNMCVKGKNYYGFAGTGSLSGTWKSIGGYTTGNKQGRLKYGSKWHPWTSKNKTVYFPTRGTVSGVARK